jgi:hypothetical protein
MNCRTSGIVRFSKFICYSLPVRGFFTNRVGRVDKYPSESSMEPDCSAKPGPQGEGADADLTSKSAAMPDLLCTTARG